MTHAEIALGAGAGLLASSIFLLGYLLGTVRGTRKQIDDIIAEEWERWERLHQR